jgi:hypothetical protein
MIDETAMMSLERSERFFMRFFFIEVNQCEG